MISKYYIFKSLYLNKFIYVYKWVNGIVQNVILDL